MFTLNGNTINIYRSYTAPDGTKYPNLRNPATRAALGIVEVADPVRLDDRFYWNGNADNPRALDDVNEVWSEGEELPDGVSVGDPKYVQVLDNSDPDHPVMVDTDEQLVTRGLKYTWKQQIKTTAGTMLATTDWYVTRKAEHDTAIPANIVTYRAAVRTECDRLETAIDGAADIEAFISVVQSQNWPEQPE
jgi:hypothetical protein